MLIMLMFPLTYKAELLAQWTSSDYSPLATLTSKIEHSCVSTGTKEFIFVLLDYRIC